MIPIVRREITMMRLSTLLWVVTILLLVSVYLSVFPSFNRDTEATRQLFSHLPQVAQNILGVGVQYMFSFLGFFGNVFPFITLVGSVMAMNLGVGLLTKERLAKTTDFLLTKPVTRGRVFAEKLLAGWLLLTTTSLVVAAASLAIAALVGVGSFDQQRFLLFWVVFYVIQLWFFAVGVLLSQLYQRIKSVIAVSLTTVFGFFVLNLLAAIIGDETIRCISPFKYFHYIDIVMHGTLDGFFVALAAVVITTSLALSYGIYRNRDVPLV